MLGMGTFDLHPGEEPFGDPTDTDRAEVVDRLGGKRPSYKGGKPMGPQWNPDLDEEGNWTAQNEDAVRMTLHEKRVESADAHEKWKAMSPAEQEEAIGPLDPEPGNPAKHNPSITRRSAFSYGIGQIAGHLRSISEHPADLHSASRRYY